MKSRQAGYSQATAAAKAGISERSGRRIDNEERSAPEARHWRTRKDPFDPVWETELVPLLAREPSLTGITLWEYLDDQYPKQYPEQLLRTLQRRIKQWRASDGSAKPVIFRQSLAPGHQGLSDFTHPSTPVTIAGEPFAHLLYQFRLAYSGWRHVHIVRGGESYSALADGLQNALHALGGAPVEHRTDSLSAAYINDAQKQRLTQRYEALCQHYGMRATTNNPGVSHENGAIEAPHGSLKRRIDQAMKVRGSADFTSTAHYRGFIERIVERLNKRCQGRLTQEHASLQTLPAQRAVDYLKLSVRVTTSSTIGVKRCLYTVPSRLIGEHLHVHLYHDRLECFVGQRAAIVLTRVYPGSATGRARRIDYRHIIHSLAAKPQAFRFSQFRDDILPDAQYRQLWSLADAQFSPQQACKWMVAVLRFAYDYDCQNVLAIQLLTEADKSGLPDLKSLQARYVTHTASADIAVRQHTVDDYDQLLEGRWMTGEVACG
jgi:transposase InsO family protein